MNNNEQPQSVILYGIKDTEPTTIDVHEFTKSFSNSKAYGEFTEGLHIQTCIALFIRNELNSRLIQPELIVLTNQVILELI